MIRFRAEDSEVVVAGDGQRYRKLPLAIPIVWARIRKAVRLIMKVMWAPSEGASPPWAAGSVALLQVSERSQSLLLLSAHVAGPRLLRDQPLGCFQRIQAPGPSRRSRRRTIPGSKGTTSATAELPFVAAAASPARRSTRTVVRGGAEKRAKNRPPPRPSPSKTAVSGVSAASRNRLLETIETAIETGGAHLGLARGSLLRCEPEESSVRVGTTSVLA